MKESKEEFTKRKKLAIDELMKKATSIMDQLANDPEFDIAIQDRLAHIERGELWITPAAMKYAPMIMQLEQIRVQISKIRAATYFTHNN